MLKTQNAPHAVVIVFRHAHAARVAVLGARRSHELTRGAELFRVHHVIVLECVVMLRPIRLAHNARIRIADRRPRREGENNERRELHQVRDSDNLGVLGRQRRPHKEHECAVGAENEDKVEKRQDWVALVGDIAKAAADGRHAAFAADALARIPVAVGGRESSDKCKTRKSESALAMYHLCGADIAVLCHRCVDCHTCVAL